MRLEHRSIKKGRRTIRRNHNSTFSQFWRENSNLNVVWKHIVRNLHFLSKKSTLISCENCRFFWVKNSWKCCGFGLFSCWQLWFRKKNCRLFLEWKTCENVVVLDYLAVDNFDFTRKIVKKYLCEKLVKLNFWTKIWLFE